MEIIVYWLVFGVIFGALGAWIANEKHRDQGEGFILGFLFCPLGVIIEAVLPNPPQAVLEPTPQPTAEELARQRELLEQQREQQRQEEAIRRQVQQLAEQQRQEEHAQHDRQEAESRLSAGATGRTGTRGESPAQRATTTPGAAAPPPVLRQHSRRDQDHHRRDRWGAGHRHIVRCHPIAGAQMRDAPSHPRGDE